MAIETMTYSEVPEELYHSVFSDRRHQFVARHEWDLCVTPEGLEIDEYDTEGSEYLVVHEGGRHLTSCRLRLASRPTMLLDHFTELFPRAEDFLKRQAGRVYELTRFLKAPSLTVHEGTAALLAFAEGLDRFRDERDAVGFVAVVYPAVSRFLRQSGVRFLVLDVSELAGRKVELVCLTQAVAAAALLARQNAFAIGAQLTRPTSGRPACPSESIAA